MKLVEQSKISQINIVPRYTLGVTSSLGICIISRAPAVTKGSGVRLGNHRGQPLQETLDLILYIAAQVKYPPFWNMNLKSRQRKL